jgi:hypothetical protein
MREVEVARDAVFTADAPAALAGRRLHESSELRDERFASLLEGTSPLGLDELGAIMADHGPQGEANDNTPCMHGSYWYTTACLQFLPCSGRIRAAYGSACCAGYQEIEL